MMRQEPRPHAELLTDYQRVLDDVYERSRTLVPAAPTWQAALYESVRACYTQMRSHPEALHLHFIATTRDPDVQRTRTRHRARLLRMLHETRVDAPPDVHAELLLSMIHTALRKQVLDHETPPALDEAEHTFASLLFHCQPA